eukprot:4480380-Ditylum_brightwellii.AAC.1
MAFYLPSLDGIATTLKNLLTNVATSDNVNTLAYDQNKDDSIIQEDFQNMLEVVDSTVVQLENLPNPVVSVIGKAVDNGRAFIQLLELADISAPAVQEQALRPSQLLFGALIASDMFNHNYPAQ